MKHWKRLIVFVLALALVFGTIPIATAGAISLDEYERENYLKPDSSPMDATPTVIEPETVDFQTAQSTVQSLDGDDWLMAEGGTEEERLSSISLAADCGESNVANLFDGEDSYWETDSEGEAHWASVDMGYELETTRFIVNFDDSKNGKYIASDFEIQGSVDGDKWETLKAVTDNTQAECEVVLDEAANYQHYRLYIPVSATSNTTTTTSSDQYTEIWSFTPYTFASVEANTGAGGASVDGLFDGDTANEGWFSNSETTTDGEPCTIIIDLGESKPIDAIRLYHATNLPTYAFTLEGSNDKSDWTPIDTVTDNKLVQTDHALPEGASYRYIRYTITEGNDPQGAKPDSWARMREIQVGLVDQWAKALIPGSTVTTSHPANSFKLPVTNLIDGNFNTLWAETMDSVPGSTSITATIDLKSPQRIDLIRLHHDYQNPYPTADFAIYGSVDSSEGSWEKLVDVVGNEELTTEHSIDTDKEYQYLRLEVTKCNADVDDDVRLFEIEAWQFPADETSSDGSIRVQEWEFYKTDMIDRENLTQGKPVEASSHYQATPPNPEHFTPDNVTDGEWGSSEEQDEWVGDASAQPHWVIIDMGESQTFNKYAVYSVGVWRNAHLNLQGWEVQVSDDQSDWQTVSTITGNTDSIRMVYLDEPATGRYIRLNITNPGPDGFARLYEFQALSASPGYVQIPIQDWAESIPATVPASVHTNLMNAGLLEDPYVGLNDADAQAQSLKTWWFSKTFYYDGPAENVRLNFEGVCDRADFWLNGVELGSHQGMFGGPYFDVTDVINQGENKLVVRLNPAIYYQQTVVFNCTDGWHYARIWPLGIWNSVSVEDVNSVEILDPFIAAKDAQAGTMDFSVDLQAADAFKGTLKLKVSPKNFAGESTTYSYAVDAASVNETVRLQFDIPNPQLWWPNNYGDQNLYWLEVSFEDEEGNVVDYDKTSFGIRTIEMAPTPSGEADNKYNWTFVINGEPLFLKGTGWCTNDAIMRFDEARYDRILSRAREQGIQIIRAWGGGMPETETFYDLCDEYGIGVYQEWPTAWNSFVNQPSQILYETVELNTKRLRNRASLLMWGGGNEGAAELTQPVLNHMGKLTLENDGTRPWHRQDPWGAGSSHNYAVYWSGQPLDTYLNYSDTFIGEFGLANMPMMESIRKYATEEEINTWPVESGSSIWHHTPIFGTGANPWATNDIDIMTGYASDFIEVNSVEDLVIGSQLSQVVGIRHTLEHARTLWPNTTGICYYKMNDVYPAASWSTVDWYGTPKLGHYFFQDAYQPLAAVGIVNSVTSYNKALSIPIWLLDDVDALADSAWEVDVRAYNGSLELVKEQTFEGEGSIGELHTKELGDFELTAEQTKTAPLFIVTDVVKDGVLAARNYFFLNYNVEIGSLFTLPVTSLEYEQEGNVYTVTNTGNVPAVAVNFVCTDTTSFIPSDNYFWLEPGEEKVLTVKDVDETKDATQVVTGSDSWNYMDGNDTTPPTTPADLTAEAIAFDQVELNWTAAQDAESGISRYNVYRDGVLVGSSSSSNTTYVDTGLTESTEYTYTVKAVDRGLNESEASNEAKATTLPDTVKPSVTSANLVNETTISLTFSEPMDAASANTAANFVLNNGATVTAAALSEDGKTLTLTVSGIDLETEYLLTVSGLKDQAQTPNAMDAKSLTIAYKLAAYWTFDEGSGAVANDLTGNNPAAELKGNTTWVAGDTNRGTALNFGGATTDYASFQSDTNLGEEFTIVALAKAVPTHAAEYQVILSKGAKIDGHFEFDINSAGVFEFYSPDLEITGAGATNYAGVINSGVNIKDGEWHQVGITKSGTTVKLYVDGIAVLTNDNVTGNIADADMEFSFGSAAAEATSFPFNGAVDEVRIYNRALSEGAMAALYNLNIPATGIAISDSTKELEVGDTAQLTVSTIPTNATETLTYSWSSSDDKVATVDQTGKVTAVAEGEATITVSAKDGAFTAECTVTVKETVPVESVSLDKETAELEEGQSLTLVATVLPENATNKDVIWSSSDDEVATVDETGKVTAVKAGEATITVTTEDGAKTDTCVVTVKEKAPVTVPVESVSLDKEAAELEEGQSLTLVATVLPENATNKNVTWSSSDDKVATVDATGKVTAVAAGEATITVTTEDGSKTDTCQVTVKAPEPSEVLVTKLKIAPYAVYAVPGEELDLTVEVTPANATNQNVSWLSLNPEVAEVDENGHVIAKEPGKARIYAIAKDGSGVFCYRTVTVRQPVTKLKISPYSVRVFVGDELDLDVEVTPANASVKDVTWRSENPEVATVDQNGYVVTKSVGTSRIYAEAKDGSGVYCYRTVTVYGPVVGNVAMSKSVVERNSWENTRVTYNLNYNGYVDIRITDSQGNVVRTLRDQLAAKAANGRYATWNLKDDKGNYVPAGTYMAEVQATLPSGELSTIGLTSVTVKNPAKAVISGYRVKADANGVTYTYTLNTKAAANFYVYDEAGKVQIVKKINNISNAGTSSYVWDGRDADGNLVPKGTYQVNMYAWNSMGKSALSYGKVTIK